MFREHLIPHGFLTQLNIPPTTHEERALKELYLTLSETCQYQQFEILRENAGAVLKEGNRRSCEILRDRLIVKEQPTLVSFEEYLNQLIPAAEEVQKVLKIPVWLVQQSVLRFLVPIDEPVIPVFNREIFNLSEDALSSFGRPILGLCMRIEFPPIPEDTTQMQLRMEPYFRDPKKIYLELTTRFLQPTQNAADLKSVLIRADEFVKEKAMNFLEESLSNHGG